MLALAVAAVVLAVMVVASAAQVAHAAAGSGSIVYIKGYNVWIARGDGSGQRAVTTGGSFASPWHSPSQSDAGLVVAVQGSLVYQMDQWGTVKRTLDPPQLTNSAGQPMDGNIAQATIAPDGSKIAYTYTQYTCPIGASCQWRSVTGYTDTTALVPASKYGTTYFDDPSWVTNSRALVSGGYLFQINLHDLGRGQASHWFDDSDIYADDTDLGNAEVSRDGQLLAAVRGYGDDQQIIWYRVEGNARTGSPGLPEPMCWTQTGRGITNPTWSPDGTALAIEQPEGIEITRDVQHCGAIPMALPGGSEPAWSNAQLSTRRPVAPTTIKRFTAKKKPKVIGKPKVGKTLRATAGSWSPSPKSVTFQWTRDGKRIAGATKAKYKLKKKDRRHRIGVQITIKRAAYVTVVKTIKFKRIR
ncbi:hypothetical protein GCM10010401_12520 [Rarobacter faecitabidus]|nr:PD40 domain-containing protein [Rarobacter faecitabidus]